MFNRLIIALPILLAHSATYGNELLNLELNCGGKVRPLFASYEDEQRYTERQRWATTAMDESFSQRVTIVDNHIGEMPLTVEDSWVKIDSHYIDFYKQKGVHFDGSIDRLLGTMSFSVTLDEDNEFTDKAREIFPAMNDELRGMNGMSWTGVCEKLDPEKKGLLIFLFRYVGIDIYFGNHIN